MPVSGCDRRKTNDYKEKLMSRLFGFAVLVAAGWYIWQTMRRGALRANRVKPRRKRPDGRLVRDPQTGEYHLERERT